MTYLQYVRSVRRQIGVPMSCTVLQLTCGVWCDARVGVPINVWSCGCGCVGSLGGTL